MLPDDILIEIFDFYVNEDFKNKKMQEWMTLVHVCRRWRIIVFQSPRRLNLRLVYTPLTPPRVALDIWPPLPLIVHDVTRTDEEDVDYTIAALEHNNRVCQIRISSRSSSRITCVVESAAMQERFPELTHLELKFFDITSDWYDGPRLPDSFLGGTAPRLKSLELTNISFPGLPKLLLSATHLVKLDLSFNSLPGSGYSITPEAMATSLSTVTSLEYLRIHFGYPLPTSERRRRPLQALLTPTILPILTTIQFDGASGYLEEILAQIDAPRLNKMLITLDHRSLFDTSQLFQFISRKPTLRAPEKGYIIFAFRRIIVKFPSQTSALGELCAKTSCFNCFEESELPQLSAIVQLCTSSLPPIPTLEDLYLLDDAYSQLNLLDDVENTLWLQLLHPFTSVKNLYLCNELVPLVAPALEELFGARTTEVLPNLENIFLEGLQLSGPLHEGIETFVAARWFTGHPVAVSHWDKKDADYERPSSDIYDL